MIPYSIISLGGYHDDAWNVKDEARENRKNFTLSQRKAIAAWLNDLGESQEWEYDSEEIQYAIKKILND